MCVFQYSLRFVGPNDDGMVTAARGKMLAISGVLDSVHLRLRHGGASYIHTHATQAGLEKVRVRFVDQ